MGLSFRAPTQFFKMENRKENGSKLVSSVRYNNDTSYRVNGKPYVVTDSTCTCPDFLFRAREGCKHIWAVRLYIEQNGKSVSKEIKIENKFYGLIDYMKEKGNVVLAKEMYSKFGDLTDEAIVNKIILADTRYLTLVV